MGKTLPKKINNNKKEEEVNNNPNNISLNRGK